MRTNLPSPNGRSLQSARLSVSALVTLALFPGTHTFAQQSGASDDSGLEEVLVTARRTSESLSKVPTAIIAFNADQLAERSIKTDSDLQLAAPGLTIRQTQGNNSLTYSIRGQSADTFSGSPSAVIAYLNEVPLTIGSASSFYDLESVQVLKGPQGTLFGRNTTGGAVLYTSAKPTDKFEALARVRAGNLNLGEVEGMVNVPLSDVVLLRGAVDFINRDGYIDNLYNGDKLGTIRRKSGRLSLTINASDSIENSTVLQYTDVGGTNTGASYTYSVYSTNCSPAFGGTGILNCASGLTYSGLATYVDDVQRQIGPYKTNHPGPAKHKGRDLNGSNTTTFEINDNLTLKNILGASNVKTDSEQPQLGAPYPTIMTFNIATGKSGNELEVTSISDELQLQGKALDGVFSYITGYYFQRMTSDTLWPQTYFNFVTATNNFRIKNSTDAVYAQGTFDLAPTTGVENLRLTTGARYTLEHVSIEKLPEDDLYASIGKAKQSKAFNSPSWEIGLEYQPTPSVLTYLKTRGSYRSGGFNGSAPSKNVTATGGGNLFDSERTRDIEAGLKFRGDALGRPATFNIALYSQIVVNVQRVEFPDPDGPGGVASIAVTANVPKEKINGIEVEASLLPVSWLEVGLSGAITSAKFTENKVRLFGVDYFYGPVGDTPKRSGVAYVQIGLPAGDSVGDISLRSEVYGQGPQYFSNAAATIAPGTKLPGYGLVNARLSWKDMLGTKFSSALFGKNLGNKEYFVGGMTLAAALGHNAAAVGEPRTFGLELSYKY